MMITVVVCTYNRCRPLAAALESIARSELPARIRWEVLVVDNNSTDGTAAVVGELQGRHPGRLRYLREPIQGKSHALNLAIGEAAGEVLAFTDDDVLVEPSWLGSLTAALEDGAWAGAAGRIVPVWSRQVPRWLNLDEVLLAGPFVAFDLGDRPGELTRAPFGANMAFRRELFARHGGFRTDLGRVGDSLRCGEDTEFVRRLFQAGERLRYEPAAVVHHPVAEERLKKDYLLHWFFWYACSDRVQSGALPATRWSVAGVPLYLAPRTARWSLEWILASTPAARFSASMKLARIAGEGFGCYRLGRLRGDERGPAAEPAAGAAARPPSDPLTPRPS